MSPEQRQFVEDLARLLEAAAGLPRIAGRIYALLVVGPEERLTQRQLAERSGASLASVSSMCRLLQQRWLVERVAVPGARSEHYGLAPRPIGWLIEQSRQQVAQYADLAQQAERLAESAVGRSRLQELAAAQAVLLRAFDAAFADEEGRSAGNGPAEDEQVS
jgi:DNA-binding transcriptional regulator GbsR (MarR family)